MSTFQTSRNIPTSPEAIFAAMSQAERLARWWGPSGFTNTFHICDFKKNGQWSFTMHGPDGKHYPNETVFLEIEVPKKLVIQHVSEPKFQLTITLERAKEGTLVSWIQAFENPELAHQLESIVVPANEQNLDRLSAEVLGLPIH
jgi:uncharacterized protein YndB with AHSA1/START domain